jgi:hypothetical protein
LLTATAVIPSADFVSLLESLGSVRVTVGDRQRVVTLGRPTIKLVAGQGLRLRGEAHITWDFALVTIPVTINVWQILLAPKVVPHDGSHVLLFDPRIEKLDIKRVPGFVDEKVAHAIRTTLEKNRDRLAWDFTRTLSLQLRLPSMISPSMAFELIPRGGDVSVNESDVRLAVRFEARFRERPAVAEAVAREGAAEPAYPRH